VLKEERSESGWDPDQVRRADEQEKRNGGAAGGDGMSVEA
jgi:hypothetical protein